MADRTVEQVGAGAARAAEGGLALGAAGRRVRRAQTLQRILRHRGAVAGFVVLFLLFLIAVFAPLIAPYNPIQVTRDTLKPPSSAHLMGTDNIGRDILSRVIYGTQISLRMGFIAVG